MAKARSSTRKAINRTSGVSRAARYGRKKTGQILSQAQRRRQIRDAVKKQLGLSTG